MGMKKNIFWISILSISAFTSSCGLIDNEKEEDPYYDKLYEANAYYESEDSGKYYTVDWPFLNVIYPGDSIPLKLIYFLPVGLNLDSVGVYKKSWAKSTADFHYFELAKDIPSIKNIEKVPFTESHSQTANEIQEREYAFEIYYDYIVDFSPGLFTYDDPNQIVFIPFTDKPIEVWKENGYIKFSNDSSFFTYPTSQQTHSLPALKMRASIEELKIIEDFKLYNVRGEKRNALVWLKAQDYNPSILNSNLFEEEEVGYSHNGEGVYTFHNHCYSLLINYHSNKQEGDLKEFIRGFQSSMNNDGTADNGSWFVKLPDNTNFIANPEEIRLYFKQYQHLKQYRIKDVKVNDIYLAYFNVLKYPACFESEEILALIKVKDIADDENTSYTGGRDDDFLLLDLRFINARKYR
jgi:hypothetical protein